VAPLVKHAPPFLFLFVLGSVLWGCSSATPSTSYYLLSSPDQVASTDTSCGVKLGSATVAPYLQRTNIVLQSGTNELVPAVQHRWSEPLEAGVSRLLSRCLGGGGAADRKANVRIEHLHGNTNGTVVIQAKWSLLSGGSEASDVSVAIEEQFSASQPQPEAGYDSLVSTQRELVLELCADIKSAVSGC